MDPSIDDVLLETEEKMEQAIEHLTGELRGIRTGRATTALVENVRVDYYGAPTPLNQLAQIAVPEPRLLMIKPFDKGALSDIEKAILKSDLGITPQNDGKVIRLAVPPLSEERRHKLVAQVKDLAEQCRVSLRNVRRDENKQVDGLEKKSVFTEDQADKLRENIQEKTKEFEAKVDEAVEKKSKEILQI
ncbi:MAG: ribosome recycling factor [Planctomycetes bacterium]|nr:ribosome recycling factor [Planctomycetota bacterium]MBI3844330.1 ribosome recycling factor [Planctomycetota bacterium]